MCLCVPACQQTKPFADTEFTAHIKDSVIEYIGGGQGSLASDDDKFLAEVLGTPVIGVVHVAGPGGLGAFVMDNVTLIGPTYQGIGMNHHCGLPGTGQLCTPEYQMINVDFSGLRPVYAHESPMRYFSFGHSDGDPTLPTISRAGASDPSLPYESMASKEMVHLLSLPNNVCRRTTGDEAIIFNDAIACDVPVRRLQVWSEQQAKMRLYGPGGGVIDLKFIDNPWTDRKRGYGTNVAVGYAYRLEMSTDDATIEFSDIFYGTEYDFPIDEIELVVAVDGQPERLCGTVTSQHDRSFIDFEWGPSWSKSRNEIGACLPQITSRLFRSTPGDCSPCPQISCGPTFAADMLVGAFADSSEAAVVAGVERLKAAVDDFLENEDTVCLSTCAAFAAVLTDMMKSEDTIDKYCGAESTDFTAASRSSAGTATPRAAATGREEVQVVSRTDLAGVPEPSLASRMKQDEDEIVRFFGVLFEVADEDRDGELCMKEAGGLIDALETVLAGASTGSDDDELTTRLDGGDVVVVPRHRAAVSRQDASGTQVGVVNRTGIDDACASACDTRCDVASALAGHVSEIDETMRAILDALNEGK